MNLVTSTDGKLNGRLGNTFQVTLDGTNGSLKFINFTKGDTFTLLLKQDSTGSRSVTFPSGITWQTGQAPALQTAGNSVDVFQFACDGTNTFRDTAGAPNRLPARLLAVGLATIMVIGGGAGMVGARFNLSNGNGQGIGTLPSVYEVRDKSGSELLGLVNGTGSNLVGSGVTVVGSVNDRPASTVGSIVTKVEPNSKATNGSGTVILNGNKGGRNCYADTDGVGYTLCTGNNGTQTCKVATANECL